MDEMLSLSLAAYMVGMFILATVQYAMVIKLTDRVERLEGNKK